MIRHYRTRLSLGNEISRLKYTIRKLSGQFGRPSYWRMASADAQDGMITRMRRLQERLAMLKKERSTEWQ